MPNTAIKVTNLTKVYHLYDHPQDRLKEALNPFKKSYHHDFYALNDVSFEIKRGETVGIIGKNGVGKSTFLDVIKKQAYMKYDKIRNIIVGDLKCIL
jgi:ABC-type polysaccharide/polyol phosphate transport system ATPase subunit